MSHLSASQYLSAIESESARFREVLADVDPALLLASLVHITRDPSLLSRYAPELKMPEKADLMPLGEAELERGVRGFRQVRRVQLEIEALRALQPGKHAGLREGVTAGHHAHGIAEP